MKQRDKANDDVKHVRSRQTTTAMKHFRVVVASEQITVAEQYARKKCYWNNPRIRRKKRACACLEMPHVIASIDNNAEASQSDAFPFSASRRY